MRFVLVDNDGRLHMRTGDWQAELGPEGCDRVAVHYGLPMSGWVNGEGLLKPEVYPRNVIGSVMLTCLGAVPRPYAGPVVITGALLGTEPDPVDLQSVYVTYLEKLHRDVGLALDGKPPAERAEEVGDDWAPAVREMAEIIRTAPTQTIRFVPLAELGGLGLGGLT